MPKCLRWRPASQLLYPAALETSSLPGCNPSMLLLACEIPLIALVQALRPNLRNARRQKELYG